MLIPPTTIDVFKMGSGLLNVDASEKGVMTDIGTLAGKSIVKDGGSTVFLDCTYGENIFGQTDKTFGTFTVSGREASIDLPGLGSKYYTTIEEAIGFAMNKDNLVVTPLVSIKRNLDDAIIIGEHGPIVKNDFFMLAHSEYTLDLSVEGFEIVPEGFNKQVFKEAYFQVKTDEIAGYDPVSFEPEYVYRYFADLGNAIDFADEEKLIVPVVDAYYLASEEFGYLMNEDDVFWIDFRNSILPDEADVFWSLLTAPAGLTVRMEDDDLGTERGVSKVYVGHWTITLDGNGGKTADGKSEFVIDDLKVGESIDLSKYSDLFAIPGMVLDQWRYIPSFNTRTEPQQMVPDDLKYRAMWVYPEFVAMNWCDEDGTILKTTKQYAGQELVAPTLADLDKQPVTKEGYRLVDGNLWKDVPATVPEVASANYTINWIKGYLVTFMNEGKVYDSQVVDSGSLVAKPDDPTTTKLGVTFAGWYEKGQTVPFDFLNTKITKDTVLEAVWETLPADYAVTDGTSLSTMGKIGLNFYVSVPAELAKGMTATLTYAGQTVEVVPEYDSGTVYRVTVSMQAPDDQKQVALKLFDQNGKQIKIYDKETGKELANDEYVDSIFDYLVRWEAKGGDFAPLAKAMRNYFEYARNFFQRDTSIPVVVDPITVNKDLVKNYQAVIPTMPDGLTFDGMTLVMDSDTAVRVYFLLATGAEIKNYTFKVDGNTVTPVHTSGDEFYVEISDIWGMYLDQAHTVSVNDVEISNLSALSVVYRIVDNSNATDALKNAVMALYYYNLAAKDYFGV
jgi:hypothetical protein